MKATVRFKQLATAMAAVILFAAGSVSAKSGTTFVDDRDGNTYKKVQIGNQVWMAENLNFDAAGSKCYGNNSANCTKYGRLYNWETAMNGAKSSESNPSGVQGICPDGWHLPGFDEFGMLKKYAGGQERKGSGTKLKSSTGWNWSDYSKKSGNGTDNFGFSGLPSGDSYGDKDHQFMHVGEEGYWWCATENHATQANGWGLTAAHDFLNDVYRDKSKYLSVRCVQDQTSDNGSTVTSDGGSSTSDPIAAAEEAYKRGKKARSQDLAIAEYTEAIRLNPNNAKYYSARGYSYSRKDERDSTIADYTEAIRLEPKNAEYYCERGHVYRIWKEDYDKAIADYTEAIRIEPYYSTYKWRGEAYLGKKGGYDKAIADYTEAIRLKPNNGNYYDRGNVYLKNGDYNKAIADYEAALRLDPNDSYSKEKIAEARQKAGYSSNDNSQYTQSQYTAPAAQQASVNTGPITVNVTHNYILIGNLTAYIDNAGNINFINATQANITARVTMSNGTVRNFNVLPFGKITSATYVGNGIGISRLDIAGVSVPSTAGGTPSQRQSTKRRR